MATDLPLPPERTSEVFGGFLVRTPKPSETAAAVAAAQRLRDSCQGCAASKVKCSKDKPTCLRCKRRGAECQYFATKRPGRRRNGSSNAPSLETSISPTSWSGDFTESLMLEIFGQGQPDLETLPSSTAEWFSTAPAPGAATDAMQGLELGNWPLSPISSASDSMFPTSTSQSSGFAALADMTASPTSFPDMPDGLELSQPVDKPTASDAVFSVFSQNLPINGSSSRPTNMFPSSAQSPTPVLSDPALDSSRGACHTQALRLIRDCLENRTTKEPGCVTSRPDQKSRCPRSVIDENKRVIEAVQALFRCSCSAGDGAMLVMLCMAVLMVLDAYTVAAKSQGHEDTNSPPGSATSSRPLTASTTPFSHSSLNVLDRHDQDRTVVHLILGELHRVQCAAKEIACRLERYHEFHVKDHAGLEKEVDTINAGSATPPLFFFSVTTCKDMAQDLRRQVSLLAKKLVETL